MSVTLSVNPTLASLKKSIKKSDDMLTVSLVVLIDDNGQILGDIRLLTAYQARINALQQASDFQGKLAQTVADFALSTDKKAPAQLLLVGVGNTAKLNTQNLQKIAQAIYSNTAKRLTSITVSGVDALSDKQSKQFALALLNADYRFDKYKSEQSERKLAHITLLSETLSQQAVDIILATHKGQSLTRDVANEPGNICYPVYLAEKAQQLATMYPDLLKVTVLGEAQMQKLGMQCFLSVSRGSAREGQLVLLEYQGKSAFSVDHTASFETIQTKLGIQPATTEQTTSSSSKKVGKFYQVKDTLSKLTNAVTAVTSHNKSTQQEHTTKTVKSEDAPIVLVGKGVTFDSGGISIKPGAAMDEMKYDMGGAAAVLGTIQALCEARLPINVVGALACAENMPSGDATRPGDIVTAMNGKTVEILNTDAEGRLVLADTLSYVQRYAPSVIIDVATLTGACIIALGHVRSAVYSNNEDVLFELENASEQSGDLIWHMPMDDMYQSQIESSIADIQNIGGRPAGSVTAACFLSRFIDDNQAWAHLDIAGTAWNSGKDKAATGRPVPLFMQYLTTVAQR